MGRDEAPDIGRFGWATAASAKLVTLAARVGAYLKAATRCCNSGW